MLGDASRRLHFDSAVSASRNSASNSPAAPPFFAAIESARSAAGR